MEGKIISYFHQEFQSFVFLGCVKEDLESNLKAFDPDKIKGCINALNPNAAKIKFKNLVSQEENLPDATIENSKNNINWLFHEQINNQLQPINNFNRIDIFFK